MPIHLLLSALVIGAVFVYIKPKLDAFAEQAMPSLQTSVFGKILITGALVLAAMFLANFGLRALKVRG